MIDIQKYPFLIDQTKAQLNSYIRTEFGNIPIVNETEWATPDWTILIYENDQIVTFCNIVLREIVTDEERFKIGGINNVITPKKFRGKGYASTVLKKAETFIFNDINCDHGVLLCADDLIAFYQRLNWYVVNCPVYFAQSTGQKLWSANTMFLSKSKKLNPARIDLNGLPW